MMKRSAFCFPWLHALGLCAVMLASPALAYQAGKITLPNDRNVTYPVQGSHENREFRQWAILNSKGEVIQGIVYKETLPAFPYRQNVTFNGQVTFSPDGSVQSGILDQDTSLNVVGWGQGVWFKGGTLVQFSAGSPHGGVINGVIARHEPFASAATGGSIDVPVGSTVTFDGKGRVVKFQSPAPANVVTGPVGGGTAPPPPSKLLLPPGEFWTGLDTIGSQKFGGWIWRVRSDGRSFDVLSAADQRTVLYQNCCAIVSISGDAIVISHPQGRYHGTISADRLHVTGSFDFAAGSSFTRTILGPPLPKGPYSGGASGSVTVPVQVPASTTPILGDVWQIVETPPTGHGYAGVWTRRGSSNTFDAWWDSLPGRRVTDTLEIESVSGNQVVLFRHGNQGRYTGTLSADRKRVVSGTLSWAPGFHWTAIIGTK